MQKQTFSAKALGNEYATGVSRPAVLTTKTFLPHQRVTTEGKAMRKVECTVDRFEWNGGERKKVTDTFTGLFHEWGLEYEEFESGPGNYSVGIVELEDGKVATFPASNIKFLS
ncbi:hypothetical protein [Citrobacter amalonaticus]|uniref:hypothetical protein n=2 Tax=Enterobacteriaceae TaxID=543 RepID=UPI0018A8F16E|nr:hypothetical protein [Citrobacter amalonaticus]